MLEQKITRVQLSSWLEHPVTKAVMCALEQSKQNIVSGLASSSLIEQPHMDRLVSVLIGKLEVVEQLTHKDDLLSYLEMEDVLVQGADNG